MNIATRLILNGLALKAMAFERLTKNPAGIQKKILFEYLARNKDTEYGRKYRFADIRNISDYQKMVPMSDCDTLHSCLNRVARGEKNILTRDNPIFFGITSGTTAKPKLIPVTRYSKSKKEKLMNLWGYYTWRDHPEIIEGKILAIISPEVEGFTEAELPYGAESGHAYKNLLYFFKRFYALPYEVFEIMDYEVRYYCILRISMEEDITSIATLNPSTIVILCEKIAKYKEKIIEDIASGTLNKEMDIPGDIRANIEKSLRPDPKKAEELRRILSEKGELLPKDFWPNLELIECWKA
ncbi:MAG: GH3 auxin-responsive promoter family protein, partial [Candidatus Omnitrophota bacterium]|nr:GH3 auxin-responsive promoter family protein [Candidatus Omnitrophota bacterium]